MNKLTQNALIAVCSVLNLYPMVGNVRGRDVAASIYEMHQKGDHVAVAVQLEKLPDSIRKQIECETTRAHDDEKPTATVAQLAELVGSH